MKEMQDIEHLPVNKYNCGHETLYYILSKKFNNKLSLAEFYFLTEPFNLDVLDDGLMLSYKTMFNVVKGINKNIYDCICTYEYNNSLQHIINEIEKNNLIILFIDSKCLYYHNNSVNICPYHMILVDAIDNFKKQFRIMDFYIQGDKSKTSNILWIDYIYLSNFILEYGIVLGNTDITLEVKDHNKIRGIILEICDKNNTPFIQIRDLFDKILYEKDNQKIINSLVVLKWMVIEPLFHLLIEYCANQVIGEVILQLREVLLQWEKTIQKLLKLSFKNAIKERSSDMNINDLCDRSINVIKRTLLHLR